MQRYATVKLQILVVPVLLALCGYSEDTREINSPKDSPAEAVDPSNVASHAGNTVKVKDAGQETRDAVPTTRQTAKEGDTYSTSNFNCETVAPQDKAQCRRYSERGKSAAPLDKNSAGLVALLILFREHPGDRIGPNER